MCHISCKCSSLVETTCMFDVITKSCKTHLFNIIQIRFLSKILKMIQMMFFLSVVSFISFFIFSLSLSLYRINIVLVNKTRCIIFGCVFFYTKKNIFITFVSFLCFSNNKFYQGKTSVRLQAVNLNTTNDVSGLNASANASFLHLSYVNV